MITQAATRGLSLVKTAQTTGRAISDVEDDCISINANDEQDNLSDLLHDPSQHQSDTVSPDETLKSLGEKFDETEATCEAIKPQLADIVQKRWHKKLSANKLTSLQEKYTRPENCPEVCSMSVNPEIWAKLPHYQQQSDRNVSNIQEAVRKTALISIQTANILSNAKATGAELDVKELLAQQVDSIALLGHISHELACLRRYKIKSVLKPEFAPICVDDGQTSKFLFGDDLQKRLKEAKESSSFGPVVKSSQARNFSHKSYHPYSKRNNYDHGRHRQGGSNYETASSQKGARQPQQRK